MKRFSVLVSLWLAVLCLFTSCTGIQASQSTPPVVPEPHPVCDPNDPNAEELNAMIFRALANDYASTGLGVELLSRQINGVTAYCALPSFSPSELQEQWWEKIFSELERLSGEKRDLRADFEIKKIKAYVQILAILETDGDHGWQTVGTLRTYWDPSRSEFLRYTTLFEGFSEYAVYLFDFLRAQSQTEALKDKVDSGKLEAFLAGDGVFSSFQPEEEGVRVTLDATNLLKEGETDELLIPDCYFDGSIVEKIANRWKEYRPAQPGEKVIALTFDDGPSTANTTQVLDVLETYQAKATFFVAGHRISNSTGKVLKRIVDLGSQIGNHSFSHANFHLLTMEGIMEEINRTQELVYNATGIYPTCLRPPYGNLKKELVAQTGMYAILWNEDTLDWQHRNTQLLIDTVLADASSGDIILMHDIHKTTTDAVEAIVKGLLEQGYRLVTVEELFDLRNQEPQGFKYYSQQVIR